MAKAHFVCFDEDGSVIEVSVDIEFAPSDWRYKYAYTRSGLPTAIECDFPSVCGPHALGTPAELGRLGRHVWEVAFINIGNEAEAYRVQTTWTQGGRTLSTWRCEGEVEVGGIEVVPGRAVLVFRGEVPAQRCDDDGGCHD